MGKGEMGSFDGLTIWGNPILHRIIRNKEMEQRIKFPLWMKNFKKCSINEIKKRKKIPVPRLLAIQRRDQIFKFPLFPLSQRRNLQ